MEILRLPKDDFYSLDAEEIVDVVVEALPVSPEGVVFSGISSRYMRGDDYRPCQKGTFAVTLSDWRQAIQEGDTTAEPVSYALDNSEGDLADPVIAGYDLDGLEQEEMQRNFWLPKPGLTLADTCLQLVIWSE